METGYAIEALKRIAKEHPGKPFSLTCSIRPPHAPFLVSDPYYSRYLAKDMTVPENIHDNGDSSPYQKAITDWYMKKKPEYRNPALIRNFKALYFALVKEVDDWVGRLLDTLEETGLKDNTLVIFTSDHGEMLGNHGMNGKCLFFDESARIPLMMRLPGRIPAGAKFSTPVSQVDLFATILDYTGQKIPANHGSSLRGLMEKGDTKGREYICTVWPQEKDYIPNFMVRSGDWKLMYSVKEKRSVTALYNMKDDPLEMNNLAKENVKQTKKMKGMLLEWMAKVNHSQLEQARNTPLFE